MYFKWFWSTLMVDSKSLVGFLLISVHPSTSLDLWTFVLGPRKAKISIFGKNRRRKVHMYSKWFEYTLLFDSISLVSFLLISVHLGNALDPQRQKSIYLVKIDISRYILCILNDFDPFQSPIWYPLLLFYFIWMHGKFII